MVELPLIAGVYTICVECIPVRTFEDSAEPRFYFNETPLAVEMIRQEKNHVVLTVHVLQERSARLGWKCRRAEAPNDKRALGLPVSRIFWQRINSSDTSDDDGNLNAKWNKSQFAL